MTIPDHLKPLQTILVLALSQRARGVTDLVGAVLRENQAFVVSQTPHDAGRVAKALRFMIKEAEVAATAFEAAASKAPGVPDAESSSQT